MILCLMLGVLNLSTNNAAEINIIVINKAQCPDILKTIRSKFVFINDKDTDKGHYTRNSSEPYLKPEKTAINFEAYSKNDSSYSGNSEVQYLVPDERLNIIQPHSSYIR